MTARGTLTLRGATLGRRRRETAAGLLACLLAELTNRVERMLLSEDREIVRMIRLGILTRSQVRRTTPCAETRALLEKMRGIRRDPLPLARRQIDSLVRLLDGGEFKALKITQERVVARVTPLRIGPHDRPIAPFRIGFVPLSRAYFPMVIRIETPAGPRYVFQRFGGHGDCWGYARPLLEQAVEEADVYKMFLVAFSWALRNLPREERRRLPWDPRPGGTIRLPGF